ncbi:hypothetical protein [Terrihabitans sp. B22-R8]|uniref:hypothetical protein n=1 Tax=Terrihabitans sp. B22-R8 TaxID=3425128 RepID=UPI00403C1608
MNAEAWVATYAAIVATAALLLELRRWIESGPRISISVAPNMTLLGTHGDPDQEGLLIVTAMNRGDTPTTVTHMAIMSFRTPWHRWRQKTSAAYLVVHPHLDGQAPNIPGDLKPGGMWVGISRPRADVTGDVQDGWHWAGIHTTARRRPFPARIPARKEEPKGEKI